MKYGPLVFLAAFVALAGPWCGFVLAPQLQLGRASLETNAVNTAEMYPAGRPGLARQGLDVYRANGCAYCHSQQIGQKGTLLDVMLTDVGNNPVAVADALTRANLGLKDLSGPALAAGLPKPVVRGVELAVAESVVGLLKTSGAKSELRVVPVGPDIARGWGLRRTVAEDFVSDSPVMPGSQRIGPDLANVGMRLPDANWHLLHLYAPQAVVPGSPMPPFRFLFEKRKVGRYPSPDALQFTDEATKPLAPAAGFEIVPTADGKALVAYLQSLRADVPLFEAPITPAKPASTNAPAPAPAK